MDIIVRFGKVRLSVSNIFAAAVALLLIYDETGSAQLGLCAAAFHEAGHLLTMAMLSELPEKISLTPFGMCAQRRESVSVSYRSEVVETLAGPAANLCLAAIIGLTGIFAGRDITLPLYINLCMACFNLLPIVPLDGGRALRCFLNEKLGEEQSERITKKIAVVGIIPMAAIGIAVLVESRYNFTLLAAVLYLVGCTIERHT